MDDEDLVDLVASGEDTTLPCSSPEASLVAPPQFQDDPADDDDDAKSTATSYDSSDYHHQDDSRLQLLNDVSIPSLYIIIYHLNHLLIVYFNQMH